MCLVLGATLLAGGACGGRGNAPPAAPADPAADTTTDIAGALPPARRSPADTDQAEPAPAPAPARVVVTDTRVEILDKIYFEVDSAAVVTPARPLLEAIAATLMDNPQIQLVEIQGHADDQERDGDALSVARAEAVKAALVSLGVDAQRLAVRGYGAHQPIQAQHSEAGWARNRRVEFLVVQ